MADPQLNIRQNIGIIIGTELFCCSSHITDDLLDKQLERCWEIDNFDVGTSNEQRCEDLLHQTVGRDSNGWYIVRLPLRGEMLPMLGVSYKLAFRRLQSMKKKFAVDEVLRIAYYQFLEEYESLVHMEKLSPRASRSPFAVSRV